MNEKDKSRKQQMEELKKAVGISAEMSLMYFRAVLAAGATPQEASALTQAYIAAMLFGNKREPEEE